MEEGEWRGCEDVWVEEGGKVEQVGGRVLVHYKTHLLCFAI